MAITKIHPIEVTLNKALDYIEDSKKTDEKMLCTGYCCEPEIATQTYDFAILK